MAHGQVGEDVRQVDRGIERCAREASAVVVALAGGRCELEMLGCSPLKLAVLKRDYSYPKGPRPHDLRPHNPSIGILIRSALESLRTASMSGDHHKLWGFRVSTLTLAHGLGFRV